MMKKILLALVLIIEVFALWGCTPKNPSQNPTGVSQNSPKIFQIWMSGSSEEKNFLEAIGREFLSLGGADTVGYQIRVVNFSTPELLWESFLDKMGEGITPALLYADGDEIFRNINKFLPRSGDETLRTEDFRNTFVRSTHDLLIKDEQIYGIPLAVDTLAVYFNKDHTQDRLINRNTPSLAWKEFQEDAEHLTQIDNSLERFSASGVALGRSDNIWYGFEILENILLQQGVNLFTKDLQKPAFHNATGFDDKNRSTNLGIDSLNFYTSFSDPRYKYYSWNDLRASPNDTLKNFEAFAAGKVSMVFGYSHDRDQIEKAIALRKGINEKAINPTLIGVSPFPQVQNNENSRYIIGKVKALAIPKFSTSSDLGWRYAKFISRKENLEKFFKDTKFPPSRVDLVLPFQEDPKQGVFVNQAKFARSSLSPIDKNLLKAWFEKIIQDINDQKGSARELLPGLGNKIESLLNEKLRIEKEITPPTPPKKNN